MRAHVPDWLSLICQGSTFSEVEMWLTAAADYGFKSVQPVFFWSDYHHEQFLALAESLERLKLRAVAFGVYSDLYKWDKPMGGIFQSTIEDLKLAASCMHMLNTRNLVSWCGTTGDFGITQNTNSTHETISTFRAHQESVLSTLVQYDVALLFEPWHSHILADENMVAKACELSPENFKVVLDLPNLIDPAKWEHRGDRINTITETLEPHIGIIHLKDMTIQTDGSFELPMFGQGSLTNDITEAIRPYVGTHPIVAEHIQSTDELPVLIDAVSTYFGTHRQQYS